MTDTPQTPPTPTPAAPDSTVTKGAFALLGGLPGFIAGLAGASWPGVIAMSLGGIGLIFGITALISKINKMIDARDNESAGADAGRTAVDLANQAAANRQDLDDLRANDPPTRPTS